MVGRLADIVVLNVHERPAVNSNESQSFPAKAALLCLLML